jgi:putative ABC transport system permease protein
MLRSFLIITLRILWRNKVTSFINIFSLTVGITAFIFIMLYVHYELSYDKFNENYERIYRLEAEDYGKLPPVIGDYVRDRVPEIENIARLAGFNKSPSTLITYKPADNPELLKQINFSRTWADSTTFDVFTLPFIQGDPTTALDNPFTVVLTESNAQKLFGDKNPMGETVEFDKNQYEVTGIIKDIKNAHIEIDALFSLATIEKRFPTRDLNDVVANSWLWSATYLLMAENVDQGHVEEKINNVLAEINDGNLINIIFKGFHIRPLKDVYFKGTTTSLQYGKQGNLKLVQTFIAVAVFILVLACVNYVNLTTARATLRTKEVAMKKVAGSTKALLRYQFIIESILITMISFGLAFTIVQGLMPQYNQLALVNISLAEINTPVVWGLSILGVLSIGLISGLYPAFYLTTIKSVALIKGETMKGSRRSFFRNALLTFQFSISILLIIGIITNLRQLHYARAMDLGFNKEQIIRIATPTDFPEAGTLRKTIKGRLLQNPDIRKVAFTTQGVGNQPAAGTKLEIDGIEKTPFFMTIDPDFLDLMEVDIIEGRNFSWDREGDKFERASVLRSDVLGIIFNETAIREFGIELPVGKIINMYWRGHQIRYKIIGIARDFHSRSVHHKIEPVVFFWTPPQFLMNVKISPSNIPTTIKFIENEWKNVYGSAPFSYVFLDESFDKQYKSDDQAAKIIGYFTILAIIIACMGLFALSSFMAARRTKEIGIRKAMGATSQGIFLLLSKEFLKWVLIAVIIVSPVAWIVMNKWLEGFAYHINLRVDIFILAAMIAIAIAIATVAWQSLKTALANPIHALRYE